MRKFALAWLCLVLFVTACASDAADPGDVAQPAEPTATPDPSVRPTPTAVVIPTTTSSDGAGSDSDGGAAAPTSEPTVAPATTPTPRPIPTAVPTPIPTAAPTPTPRPTTQPTPVPPTATPVPTATATAVRISCDISKRDIAVGEIITLTAQQNPDTVPITFAFDHGDGTVDQTSQSSAFYREPGTYEVRLLWRTTSNSGSITCGSVVVRAAGPTPTPEPTATPTQVQIGCTISVRRPIVVGEIITFTAVQDPTNVPVQYVFDHGDGTRDVTNQSFAFYEAPGNYEVRMDWAHSDTSGTILCGTVVVVTPFNAGDYLGKTQAQAEATAAANNFVSRIGRIDDESFALTQEVLLNRVTFEIDNGLVTVATQG